MFVAFFKLYLVYLKFCIEIHLSFFVVMRNILVFFVFNLLLFSCTSKLESQYSDFLDSCGIVASEKIVKGDTIIYCDLEKIQESKDVPLKLLADDFQSLLLDEKAGEFPMPWGIYASDNYIILSFGTRLPLKLFKKDGTFLTNIGEMGNGIGQYRFVFDVQIEEKGNEIFLLSLNTSNERNILVYKLNGKYSHSIPLANETSIFPCLKVLSSEKKIIITNPFSVNSSVCCAWVQDFEGNLIHGVYDDEYERGEYSSMAVNSQHHTNAVVLFNSHFDNNNELLYHYVPSENRLVPKLEVNTTKSNIHICELSNCYIVEETQHEGTSDNSVKFIVDKRTKKGCKFNAFLTPEGLLLRQYGLMSKSNRGYWFVIKDVKSVEEILRRMDITKLTEKQQKSLETLRVMTTKGDTGGKILFMAKLK